MILFCDLETFSTVDLKKAGTHAYAEKSEIMLFAYAIDDGPVEVVDLTDGNEDTLRFKRQSLIELMEEADMTVWHNGGMFDKTILEHAWKYHLPIERIHDTMVHALTVGLPGGLGHLCDILRVPVDEAKGKEGRTLINLFCKPRPKNTKLRRANRDTNPREWAAFIEYARLDISAMRVLYNRLPTWNYKGKERELWYLDNHINNRGITVDRALAATAVDANKYEQSRLSERAVELTAGAVKSARQNDAMLAHILAAYDVDLPDMQKSTLERRMEDPELPWALRELLAVRLQASTTSNSKYEKLMNATSADGRIRGLLQFCGASRTGRWAGRTFQPQNLPRMKMKPAEIEAGIAAIKAGVADLVTDNVNKLTSGLIRSTLVSAEKHKLYVADLSNIEGRVAAWLAGEQWKLNAFADYDTIIGRDAKGKAIRKGPDLYNVAYAKSFNVDVKTVDDEQRQVGKVQELALGYEGGVGAFCTFALNYSIDLDDMAEKALPFIPQTTKNEANSFWGYAMKKRGTMGLEQRTFVACDALKRLWREAHPQISSYWKELEHAAILAIGNKGTRVPCRKLTFRCDGAWLRMILPSGRALVYAMPRVNNGKITYRGVNQYTRRWQDTKTYGGKLFENACQAVARDIMAWNIIDYVEPAGYRVLLTVHDELITEAPDNKRFTKEGLSNLLSMNPHWAMDLPLAADGFEAYRYRK